MMDIAELESLYQDALTNHRALFAEQRSNLLLVAGNHYNKKDSRFWRKLREVESLSKTQKLRLTKNHIQKITKTYINNILAFAPGIAIGPKNEDELSDVAVASMHNDVWQDLKKRHKFKKKKRQFVKDYVEIGEMICKVMFDPAMGDFLGYEIKYGEDGLPIVGKDGVTPEHTALFTGDINYERIHGFNFLTDPQGRSWEECRYACIQKMMPIKDLEKQFEGDEEKLTFISTGTEETYKIFDSGSSTFGSSKDMVMVKEWYFRPCADYPNGYYYITTRGGILFEGELPLGIFPIVYMGFDEASTSARSFSIIKQLRPYQAEVNRSASKIAEHQITLGDDKLLLLNGSSMEPGGTAHGVKAVKVTGTEPKIMTGRDGGQHIGYMTGQIEEMYSISNVREDSEEKSANQDPYTMLFRKAEDKKKFVIYIDKVQEFEEEICEISLRYAKAFYPDEKMIPVLGRKGFVNIAEFRDTDDLSYQISIEPQSEDLESRIGKQLSLNHLIQYAGANMQSKDLGRIIRSMEYINKEQLFDDETIDYDNATADILAMDRGKVIPADSEENHDYVIKRLIHRTKQKDFQSLPPEVQTNYRQKLQQHRDMKAEQIKAAQAAKDGFIPSGGFLVSCDFYMSDPKDPMKQKRLRVPAESLMWLQERLEQQGTTQDALEQSDLQTQARVAQVLQMQQQGQGGANQLPPGAAVNF